MKNIDLIKNKMWRLCTIMFQVDITCNLDVTAAASTVHSEDLGDVVTDPALIDQVNYCETLVARMV